MKSHEEFTFFEWLAIAVAAIIAVFLVFTFLIMYQNYRTREQVKELLPTSAEKALSSQGKIRYEHKYSPKTISALVLSVNRYVYQGETCRVFDGNLEKERVVGNYVVAKYIPVYPGFLYWCPAGVLAFTKEDWTLAYAVHLVSSGESLEAQAKEQAKEDRLAAERKKSEEAKKKALDFLKQEGLLDER